jgi:hypothetical protein
MYCRGFFINTHTERQDMKGFIIGTIFGLVLATVGFSGIAKILDHGVDKVKTTSQEIAK